MKKIWLASLLIALLTVASARADAPDLSPAAGSADSQKAAAAQDGQKQAGQKQDGPEQAVIEDDGTIRLTPDRTKVLYLDEDAGSVIVNNPAKAVLRLETPRRLLLMPREPGATSFTILNPAGKVIMEKSVIVSTAAKKEYVRIRRSCPANDRRCNESSYFYCPDGCFEITPVEPNDSDTYPPPVNAAAPAAANGGGQTQQQTEQQTQDLDAAIEAINPPPPGAMQPR